MTPHAQLFRLHRMLRLAGMLVPRAERTAWQAEWTAELAYVLQRAPGEIDALAAGMFPDAATLRMHDWRNRWDAIDWRAPGACLRALGAAVLALTALTAAEPQVRHLVFSKWGYGAFACFLALALLTVPSTLVTRASRFADYDRSADAAVPFSERLRRWRFLGAKVALVLMAGYLVSLQITRPFMHWMGFRADWILMASGLLLNVFALRWVLLDQKARCPTCMRLLRNPASIGPPSWSFLHWSGMEEICDRGHGLLQLPHWETSWCENPRWLQLDRSWSGLFRH